MFNPFSKIESQELKEQLKESEIILRFRRHAKKESNPDKTNEELLLTPEGRSKSRAAGRKMNAQLEVSVAGGSQMDRSQEAALLLMLANQDEIKDEDNLETMKNKIRNKFRVGTKLYSDERLGFVEHGEVGKHAEKAIEEGRYFDWLANDSDGLALKYDDKKSSTYTREAANIAEIFLKYSKAGNNFNKLVNKKGDYEKFGNHLERYLGTHAGTGEAFISKILEIQKGPQARLEFIQNNKSFWKELTGLDVHIKNQGISQAIYVSYPDGDNEKEIRISPESITQILDERNNFEKQFENKSEI